MSIVARIRRTPIIWAVLFVLACCGPASAQTTPPIKGTTTTIPGLTVANTLTQLVRPVSTAPHTGEAIGLATGLAITTAPFGAASGGFLIKLDPSTGLQVRTATTFGPSFAERALTSGEGKLSAGVNFMSVTYNRLGKAPVDGLQLRSSTASSPAQSVSGVTNLLLTSKTAIVSARMGVTDKFDVGMLLPIVTVKLDGTSTLQNGNGDISLFAQGAAVASGLGDVAGLAKYRFLSFGGGQPDPGGLAVMATLRFPTGDRDSWTGLGITRTLVSLIASSGRGRFRPHANVGYEWWSKGISAASDYKGTSTVTARNEMEYAAGLELEAAPKVTLLVDFLGREIFGGGKLGFQADASLPAGVSAASSLVSLPEGLRRMSLAPGLRVNLKGKMLLSLNALIALKDDGFHAKVTPVAGIDMSF